MPLRPSEFVLDLVAVDRIAPVMTRPIGDKGDEVLVIADCGLLIAECRIAFYRMKFPPASRR